MKKGFTLSEVLITLGVLGVVAVLTIPGMMRNYQNKLYTAQLKKIYAQLSEGAQTIMNDEHVDSFYETSAFNAPNEACTTDGNCTAGIGYFLNNYVKTIKNNCSKEDEGSNNSTCVYNVDNVYKTINGNNVKGFTQDSYCVQTASGATICGIIENNCASVAVDVNGTDKPNIAGRDIFAMDIHANGSLSDYGSGCRTGNLGTAGNSCSSGENQTPYAAAAGCLNNIIDASWKMEY